MTVSPGGQGGTHDSNCGSDDFLKGTLQTTGLVEFFTFKQAGFEYVYGLLLKWVSYILA
jgi:hypothetical protein